MGLKLDYAEGQTPMAEEEKEGLKILSISTRGELDEFEQQNIENAIQWTIGKKFKSDEIFTESFINNLHKRMYKNVWNWAGEFRKTNKNIGVENWKIPVELKYLLDDIKFWLANKTFPPEEIAIRFKHRLVSIHCYANGNGRHSRLMADIIIEKIFNKPIFSWGNKYLSKNSVVRQDYIKALKMADNGDYSLLIAFSQK